MDNLENYRCKIKEQVDKWVLELEELKEKAEKVGTETARDLPEQIKKLEGKIDEGTAKLKELAEANEESWESIKTGFDSAWKSLSSGFKEAAENFKWEIDKDKDKDKDKGND